MKKIVSIIVALTAVVSLAGCGATMSQQNSALIGGALGAGIPMVLEESSKVIGGGALIGAAVGAVLGSAFSSSQQGYGGYESSTPAYSEIDAARARAYAETKQRILQKRQREAVAAAKKEGEAMAEEEMAER